MYSYFVMERVHELGLFGSAHGVKEKMFSSHLHFCLLGRVYMLNQFL
jgi:hypothetical protein